MDARYLKASTALPSPVKVCGKVLRPFCLRHRLLLESVESPFLNPENSSFRAWDVIVAVRILSGYDKQCIGKPLTIREWFHLQFLRRNRTVLARNVGRIIGYLSINFSYPKFWEKEGVKKMEKLPWVLSCVSTLTRNGCTLEEAWTMPESEAIWMSVCHGIYDGNEIQILSTEEEEQLKKFDDIVDKFKSRMGETK